MINRPVYSKNMALKDDHKLPISISFYHRLPLSTAFQPNLHWFKLLLLLSNPHFSKTSGRQSERGFLDEPGDPPLERRLEFLLFQPDIYLPSWNPKPQHPAHARVFHILLIFRNKAAINLLGEQGQKHDSESRRPQDHPLVNGHCFVHINYHSNAQSRDDHF